MNNTSCLDNRDAQIAEELQKQAHADQMTTALKELDTIMTTVRQKLGMAKIKAFALTANRGESQGWINQVQQELDLDRIITTIREELDTHITE